MPTAPVPQRLPEVSNQMIAFLSERFPDRVPRGKDLTLLEIGRLQGQQAVIDFLRQINTEQHKR